MLGHKTIARLEAWNENLRENNKTCFWGLRIFAYLLVSVAE